MFQCGVTVGLRLGGSVGCGRVQEEHRRQSAQQARHYCRRRLRKMGVKVSFELSSLRKLAPEEAL